MGDKKSSNNYQHIVIQTVISIHYANCRVNEDFLRDSMLSGDVEEEEVHVQHSRQRE